MSEGTALSGTVIAIVGTGSDLDRAIAVACGEAGADLALGTESEAREHDYGMNSIANEIWAIGRAHSVRVLTGPDDIGNLVRDARSWLGRCDAVVSRWELGEVEGVPVVAPDATGEGTLARLVTMLGR